MPRPRRAVQLAPGSLALVLRRRREAAGEPSGAALFRAFRRANARCHWNAGLARAVSRVSLQGWLRGGVLLLQGPAAPLQLLRDAWLRRALRPPQGFLIRAVGDVSPIHMNPISQSQFVPLAEILCCAISDMNAAHVIVTQETLMDQLVKHYPGIATPSQEILYSVLGTLIRERKIYHTGEGYFIVTPHTYFITNNVMKDNKKFLLEDNCPLLPSTSYLVSMESSADLTKENVPMVSHCRSCHCFPAQAIFSEQRRQQLINHEPNGRGQKGSGELKPSVQNQPLSKSVETQSCDTTKSLTSMKEKEKCKKFGLSLFWCSTSKKEKPKKKYSSFSAQFPPEEWPVRDEDNLDNIPRDIEHEIIKRINPVLTVDNLVKHTVLMKKFEEQKKYISKGTSTEMLTIKQRHSSKGCVLKKQSKTAKHHRKIQSNKEKQIRKTQRKSQVNEVMSENDKQEKCAERLSHVTNEVIAHEQLYEDATVVKSHFIYKKQIKNPFQGLPCREKLSTKGHKGQKNSQFKSRIQKQEWNFQRSRSLDSSRTFDHEAIQSNAEKRSDKAKQNKSSHINNSSLQPIKGHFSECSNYPQCSTLRIDNKCNYSRESSLSDYVYREANKKVIGDVPNTPFSYIEDMFEFKEEIKYSLSSKDTHQCDKPAIICELLDQTSNQFQNFSLSNDPADANQFKQSENGATQRLSTDKKNELMFNNTITNWPESVNPEKNGFTDDQTLYQKVDDYYDDDDACSSLYLEEEDYPKSYQQQLSHTISETGEWSKGIQQIGTELSLRNWGLNIHPAECNTNVNQLDSCGHEGNECHSHTGSMDSSQECQKMHLAGENCFRDRLSQFAYTHHEEEVDLAEHVQASDIGVNIFDFYRTNEGDSDAETLPNTPSEMREKSACWTLGLQTMEMRKKIGKKQQLFNSTHTTISGPNVQKEPNNLEGTENQSITGDSGIDSPRTQSLTSNNSAILDGLRRRRSFLQKFEGINNSARSGRMLTENTLLQLTPVMNV
ncbi:transmembrane protein 68-like [Platysternon megacephalum]|uniref:Transmembrane protein 68-like n=1 Tax=Platysternon megacephalum TaxID=55544 RepID=A0A4D9EMH6_9SAUR|nr:transmembrane protein 68-like [Platysternon megacephalum]